MFRMFFQGNPFREATKGMAKGAFFTGLLFIGLGMLVWLLKEIIAVVFMFLFFMTGVSAIGYAIRLFMLQHRMKNQNDTDAYRKNVQIHHEEEL